MIRQDLHLHTTFSDGLNTPEEMTAAALSCRLSRICFTDHVRSTSDWWPDYYHTCMKLSRTFSDRIAIDCGVEAKLCDFEGHIDTPPALAGNILRVAAIHRLPIGNGQYWKRSELKEHGELSVEYWKRTIAGIPNNPEISRLAHPFSLLPDMDITMDALFWEEVVDLMEKGTYLIEYNRKYRNDFVPERFWSHFRSRVVVGSDSHSASALCEMWGGET